VDARLEVVGLAFQLGDAGAGRRGKVRRVGGGEDPLPVAGAVGAVDGVGEEAGHTLQQGRLGEVDSGRMAGGGGVAAQP
jgi:hypothetical protein